jgi:glycosyltransferase involved in cell wall biosynthesis
MHILMIADGRSPITRRWIQAIQPLGYRISLVSTFQCSPVPGAALVSVLPVAFAAYAGSQAGTGSGNSSRKKLISVFRPLLAWIRHLAGPFTLSRYQAQLLALIDDLRPDLVHALRIPYEGMLASVTPAHIPLLLSTWGNDLTLHAPSTPWMRRLTRQALKRADGLLSDTHCDITRAAAWGFNPANPRWWVVGNGGLDLDELQQTIQGVTPANPPQVINPRGIRSYVRTDTFFKSIPLVLARHPETQFICTSMARQKDAINWVKKLKLEKNVTLLPYLDQHALWQETARSLVSVSISTHDGTPNTLLEAMALGSLPICGDLPSIREWITPGENGLLVPADDPSALADAICRGLTDSSLHQKAALAQQKKDRADCLIGFHPITNCAFLFSVRITGSARIDHRDFIPIQLTPIQRFLHYSRQTRLFT